MRRRLLWFAFLAAATARTARAQSPQVILRRDTAIVLRAGAGVRLDSIKTLLQSLQRLDFGSDEWLAMSHHLDSLVGTVVVRGVMPEHAPVVRGWIGYYVSGPSKTLMNDTSMHVMYFAHPSIVSVEPESPAGRAGIVPGDVLVAYNGVDVVEHDFNMSELLVPGHKIDVRIQRDGEPRDFTLPIAKTPQRFFMRTMPDMPAMRPKIGTFHPLMLPGNVFIIGRDGVLGATMSTVGPELARALKLAGTGVLVNQVVEHSPAAVAGVRAGDLVVSVDSKPVATFEELRAFVQANMDRHEIPLRVVRDRKAHDITVKW